MVALDVVKQSNSQLKGANLPKVAVFVGGTSGIGQHTISELVETGVETKIYLIGRPSSSERAKTQIATLKHVNPNAEVVWLAGEVSLLADVKKICTEIQSKETSLDLLFMSTGVLPFNGRKETSEGLDPTFTLQHFSRMAFITHLLPLLRASPNGRVVSIKGGGLEKADIDVDDLELKKPGAYGAIRSQVQVIAMNTLVMEKFAEQEPDVAFVHTFPGQVNTGNNMTSDVAPNSLMHWAMRLVVGPLVKIIGLSPKESAQRHLFASTSALYGGRGVPADLPAAMNTRGGNGPGLFLVNQYCDASMNEKVLGHLRETAREKTWVYTQEVLRPFL
ncbi:unnamed protein product [Clonostachys rosea f. rosea IK726]|uniref:Ketoreductase (KR) domain-containing protein n=2 Tax=Bionectria ochroleuca TaxID=29856 RepID=A0A0B7JY68_BIOOC|nr:unnamed protein product [Clonostachys rosea f. rosea IK726]